MLCEQALSQCQDLAYRDGEAGTWDSLGYIHHHRGDHAEAIRCYQESIDIFHDDWDRFASLFTEDGAWRMPHVPVEFEGREDIRAGAERIRGTWAFFV